MALGKIFKKKEEKPKDYFWSLIIGKGWVESGIWCVVGETVQVIAKGGVSSWQEGNAESLIAGADSSLSAAAANLEEDIKEPNKVVFGLPLSWTGDGSIKKDYLELLKRLSKELELVPAGFVAIQEAIVHWLKSKEGVPVNGILVGLTEDYIDVSLSQNGKIVGASEVARSIGLGADVAEGLARFSSLEQHPSRIIVYDHKVGDLDEARQGLIDADWQAHGMSFLHTPKVEILPCDVHLLSVSLAGGAEVGAAKLVEVVGKDGDVGKEDKEAVVSSLQDEDVVEEGDVKREALGEERKEDEGQGELEEPDLGELGFSEGVDVARKDEGLVLEEADLSQSGGAEAGGRDVSLDEKMSKGGAGRIWSMLRLPLSFFSGRGVRLLGVVLVGLVAILVAAVLAYWYLPKAHVVVYVAPRSLEKIISFGVDPGVSSVDKGKNVIPGRVVSADVSGEKTTATSGTRTIGEKARGEVVIYHVGGETLLEAGTVLTGPNDLGFTLDEEVTIPAGSSLTSQSETTVFVTAQEFGAQYNLASGTEFSVGNFSKSDFVAKNDEDFTGGASRDVAAVSKEDLKVLEEELSQEILRRGISKLKSGLTGKEILLENSALLVTDEVSFSHDVGEEADTLKLVLSGKAFSLVVSSEHLNDLVSDELEGDVPEGFVFREDQVSVDYKVAKGDEDDGGLEKLEEGVVLEARVNANLLPQVNPDEVTRSIAGKYPALAKDYLSTVPGFVRAEVSFNFGLPGRLETLPRLARNISLEIRSER